MQIVQQVVDQDDRGDDPQQPAIRFDLVLKRAHRLEFEIAFGKRQFAVGPRGSQRTHHGFDRFQVARGAGGREGDMGDQARVLAVDCARPPHRTYLGEPLQRHDFSSVGNDRHASQLVEPFPNVALKTDLDGIAFASFDGGRHIQTAQSGRDNLVDHHGIHAVPGGLLAIHFELEIGLAHHDVGVHGASVNVGQLLQTVRHGQRGLPQSRQGIPVDPHCHRGFDAALQHYDAAFDRLQRRCGRDSQDRRHGVDFIPDLPLGHSLPPLLAGFEHHVGFDHGGWGRIQRRFDAADLAQHILDFGNLSDQHVLRLQDLHRLRETGRRVQAGHVEPTAFVQRDPIVRLQAGKDVFGGHVAGHAVQVGAQRGTHPLDGPQHGRQP